MHVAAISTSRADWNSVGAVAKALRELGVRITVFSPADNPANPFIANDLVRDELLVAYGPVRPVARDELEALFVRDGMGLQSLGGALRAYAPDMALLCGDRHETLQAAFCAAVVGIPIAHLAGGDVSGGSLDERWRHAITKIADVHFPTNHNSAWVILRMGEDRARLHMLGSAAVTTLLKTPIIPLAETTKMLGLPDNRPFVLVNWQPETPREGAGLAAILSALASLPVEHAVFVGPNADPGASNVREVLTKAPMPGWRFWENLPPADYLNALAHCAVLIGNSSSAFYEAPYLGAYTINVGPRQLGRTPVPQGMATVEATPAAVMAALDWAMKVQGRIYERLFGGPDPAGDIAKRILTYEHVDFTGKVFHDRG